MLKGNELATVQTQLADDPAPMVSELFTLTSNDWLVANADVGLKPRINCTNDELLEEVQRRVNLQNVMMIIGSNTLKDLIAISNKLTEQISEKRPDFLPEQKEQHMEKITAILTARDEDPIRVASFKLVGPTLALAVNKKGEFILINHILLGLTLVPGKDVSDMDVYKEYMDRNKLAFYICVSPQGLSKITGEPLSDGYDPEDCAIVSDYDAELSKDNAGFRSTVYPDGPSMEETMELAPDDEPDWGVAHNRFFAFSWIEALIPAPTVKANDEFVEEEDEEEVIVEA
jgi:hypothetical protein